MEHSPVGQGLFLRLEPGEELIESLRLFACEYRKEIYFVTSGVGMIQGLQLGFFCVNNNDYDITSIDEILDLSSIAGNICIRDGDWWPHVHIVANRPGFSTISGHVISATTHVTIEVFFDFAEKTKFRRCVSVDHPASIITKI